MAISPETKGNWPVASLPFFAGWDAPWWVMLVAAAAILLVVGGTKLITALIEDYANPVIKEWGKTKAKEIRMKRRATRARRK